MADKLEKMLMVNPNMEEIVLNNEGIDDLVPLIPLLVKMPHLRTLKLANNNVQRLPEDLSSLKLEYLDISHNPIPGLSAVIRGLFSLHNLKHLYVDLPYETDEEEIIVALTALESFNGTTLTDNGDDDLADLDERESPMGIGQPVSQLPSVPQAPSIGATPAGTPGAGPYGNAPQAWAPSSSPAMPQPSVTSPPGQSHLPSLRSRYSGGAGSVGRAEGDFQPKHAWEATDHEQVQRLYRAATSVSGRIADKGGFDDYVKNIIAHLHTLLAGKDDPFEKNAEILKTKKLYVTKCSELFLLMKPTKKEKKKKKQQQQQP